MNNPKRLLTAALVLPLVLMIAVAMPYLYLMIFGHDVPILVTGYDPQDIFRGYYVRITYPDVHGNPSWQYSSHKYLVFTQQEGYFVADSTTESKPDGGVYLQQHKLPMAFFAPRKEAQWIEKQLQSGREFVAIFKYLNGRGYIKEVKPLQ